NGLHALSADTGEEAWWVQAKGAGGVTPCVDQQKGWVFYQTDGKLMKVRAADGHVLKSVDVSRPRTCVSWNTVLVNDRHGYYVATYWFDFYDKDGKTKKMEWNSAVRVHDAELNLVWERTALPAAKKSTLTYADGKLVVGTGGHWGAVYTGSDWKYIAAYSIQTGEEVWKCDLSKYDYKAIINVPYAYGRFWAESWGATSFLFRINGATGALEEAYDYKASVSSCAPCSVACGKVLSGDLGRDGIVVTEIAENSTAEWPGPFGDPQTNTYALADEPGARPVPMRELYVGVRTAKPSAPPPRKPNPNAIALAKEARVFATEGLSNAESKVEHLTDGNPATFWHGSGTPLPQSPANILVLFSKPETICEVTIASQVFKEVLRLKDFEVYARSGQDWAGATPLAVVKDCKDVTVTCAFDPVTTDAVRVRLRDTWRPDHAYPRVCEIEVARAEPGVRGRQLQPSPIADEAEYERLLCDWAMGIKRQYPGATFEPDKGYLHYARTFVDAMLAKGTDIYGDAHSPMLVSILMLPSQKHPGQPLASVPGQRTGDRAPFGGNLFHDVMLLQAMDLLSAVTGEPKYKAAADAYLRYFLEHCPRKETGLFPWGEHAHWDFFKDAPGHTIHEYLGGIPLSFWERLWRLKPEAVVGEANGLINHVVDLETFAWNRHADITKPLSDPRPKGLSPADFPRHGGFYVLPWTFVHSKTKDPKYLDWSLRAIEHHWRLKKAPLNLPPITAGANQANMESAFSLAISLLEAAALLP
ncbi:MAG: hypothetical protein FJ279_29825, partial [Planctomycetes bacterium]|nr:hypothetical protein [Planctomycetota bacterium]